MKHPPYLWTWLTLLAGCAIDFSPDPVDRSLNTADAAAETDAARAKPDGASGGTDSAVVADSGGPLQTDTGEVQSPPEAGDDESLPDTTVGCDLSGRWLMTERLMVNAFGTQQIIINWFYVELKQDGPNLTFSRNIVCGDSLKGLFPIIITVDDTPSWDAYMTKPNYAGRKGTSQASGEGCTVSLDKMTLVRGGTVEAYRDLSVPLPTVDQEATATTPGWEDWDGDEHPGITLYVSGTISGSMYVVTRTWVEASGTIASGANSLKLPVTWNQSRATLGIDGTSLLASDGGPDPDASQHYVQLARLTADQAAGDDAAICQRMRDLAPTLTPTSM